MSDAGTPTTPSPPAGGAPAPDLPPAPEQTSAPAPAASPTPAPPRPDLVERLPLWTVPAVLLAVPLLFALVARMVPTFYDRVVWRYYWGPIKADAEGAATLLHNGVAAHSGYNVVNTASWALLLALCLLGIAQLLRRTRTPMDGKLIVGATTWVVAGSVFHVLEDVGLLRAPLQYFFITPPIYLLFAAGGVGSLAIGHYLRAVEARAGLDRALQKLWFILAIPVLVYLAMWLKRWDQVAHYVNPVWVALFALAAYVAAVGRFRRIGRIDPTELVSLLSIGWILLSIAYVVRFVRDPWYPQSPLLEALWAPVLAAAVVGLMFALALVRVGHAERRGKAKRRDFWFAFFNPINLLLLFSQMLDGFATAIGIDSGDYGEKHVLSEVLIEFTRDVGVRFDIGLLADHPTLFGFTTVKFAISLLVISAIDASSRSEADRTSPLTGLVKFAIIMVGLGPGIRNFLRMALGV